MDTQRMTSVRMKVDYETDKPNHELQIENFKLLG